MKKEQVDSNHEECFFESMQTKENEKLLKNVIENELKMAYFFFKFAVEKPSFTA